MLCFQTPADGRHMMLRFQGKTDGNKPSRQNQTGLMFPDRTDGPDVFFRYKIQAVMDCFISSELIFVHVRLAFPVVTSHDCKQRQLVITEGSSADHLIFSDFCSLL